MKLSSIKLKAIAGIIWTLVFIFVIFFIFSRKHNLSSLLTFGSVKNNKDIKNPVTIYTEESDITKVVDKVSISVVSIIVKTVNMDFFSGPYTSEGGVGTGFIVDSNGLIVTNSHVVDDPNGEYSVVLKDGTTYPVEKIHLDESLDIAILEITARNLTPIELGDSNLVKVGQKAIAIGNALGRYQNTVTVGVISGVARQLQASNSRGTATIYENALQTDAALNPGNSGGPLLNSQGQVIGINVATTYGADNISFAIPINTLKPIFNTFLVEGRIVKPYLGVSYTMITKEISQIRNLPQGAFISSVFPNSPAFKSGMKRGDIIIKVNDNELSSNMSLSAIIQQNKVGDKLNLLIDRDGQRSVVSVVLEESSVSTSKD